MTLPQPPTEAQLAAYIGPSWEKVYRRKFERFRQDPRGGFKPSWNWQAAFFPGWFLLYRLYVPFAVLLACFLIGGLLGYASEWTNAGSIMLTGLVAYVAYPVVLVVLLGEAVAEPSVWAVALATAAVALTVVQGVIADWLLYRKALAAPPVTEPSAAPAFRTGRLSRLPPSVSPVAYGIVVTIALAPFVLYFFQAMIEPSPRERAYVASMKADSRNLVTAEESYFADHRTYTATLTRLPYSVSAGNTITITSATRTGWAATAKHNGTTRTCGIYVGTATPPIPGQNEGEPKCT